MAEAKEQKAKDQKPKEQKPKKAKEPAPPKKEDKGLLETAAEAIGSTLGTIAVKTGIAHPERTATKKIPKLAKKNKTRMPRKMKKQARKAAGADHTPK